MPYQPAVLGSARLNNFRLGYQSAALAVTRSTRVTLMLAGVLANVRIRRDGFTIQDALNEAPDTCSLTVDGTAPIPGQDLRVTLNSNTPRLLFNGTLQTVEVSYEGLPGQLAWRCTAVDDTARANRKRPFGTWTDISATTIAQSLIASFASGFTSTHVEAGLPLVTITFDGSESLSAALQRMASLIGGYTYFEDLDLHFFQAEVTDAPNPVDLTHDFLDSPPIAMSTDDSQLHTRVYGKGHGEATTADVAAGETIVPIGDAVMFNPAGGLALAGTIPDGAQSQRLTYTGVQPGGVGALVGPGAAPSVPLSGAITAGAGVETGVHQYAYTWVTAAGESLPSPLAAVALGAVPPPGAGMGFTGPLGGGSLNIGIYAYAVTFVNPSGETTPGPTSTMSLPTSAGAQTIAVTSIPLGPGGTTARKVYRTAANGSQLKLITTIANNVANSYVDTLSDASLGANVPTTNTATANQVLLTGIALGPTGTTSRKVYRTAAGLAQLKLQQTIANNTATAGVTDATADGSLGANAPTSDTSGIATATGQVNAGATSLLASSAAAFSVTGGWVQLPGDQVVRYTGITGNTLTGIPATGAGAIVATVAYGDVVVGAPALVGVTGNALAMLQGTPVHVWVQRDDLPAQAAMIALDLAQGRVSDGVYEHVISDERRGEASLIALCDADLALFSRPILTVTYDTRDVKAKSGKPIVFDLPSPPISATLTIQDVTITEIDVHPGTNPRFHVTASSVRFSLEDILRRLIAGQAAA